MTLLSEQMRVIRSHQRSWPIQTLPIARDLGLRVYRVNDWPDDVSGMLQRNSEDGGESGYACYVNATHSETRRRFTIAHEIGHFVLHRSLIGEGIVEDRLMRAEGFTNKIEREANRFAADLLMPTETIEALQSMGYRSVPELAEQLNVSKDALSIRLYRTPWKDD